ncbi:MAG: TolC family outer membrane protein [Beijerinckiaceae bacterium]
MSGSSDARGRAGQFGANARDAEKAWRRVAACLALVALLPNSALAETMSSALSRAYMGNPDLNQQRASVRATDENLPRALSGFRPKVSATGNAGAQYTDSHAAGAAKDVRELAFPHGVGATITQTFYDGERTRNSSRQAESQIEAARETMRLTEENTLQNGATAYMNVLRDAAILNLRKNNITVLEEQLRQTRDRFDVGEVTRTDVAQAQSSLAQARSDFYTAQANLQNSIANFRQIIGVEPRRLEPAQTIERLLPKTLTAAIGLGLVEHPGIVAAFHQVDVAALNVKIQEGALLPTLGATGSVAQNYDVQGTPGTRAFTASGQLQLNVPIYQGGIEYANIRQAKEQLGQARLNADLQRDSVRATIVSTWGLLETAKATIQSSQSAVTAAEIALNGVREEAKVGQRTTLDVLNAQQTLLNARVALVTAQRDRVVASYAVFAAVGRLSADHLGLDVILYDPTVHFDQVKGKWYGTQTPDWR